MDAKIWSAAIAAAVALIVSFGTQIWQYYAAQKQKRLERIERALDLATAIMEEIRVNTTITAGSISDDAIGGILAEMAKDEKMTPFVSPAPENPIFDSVKHDLSLLPAEAISAVITYYKIEQGANAVVTAIYDGKFDELPFARKEKAIRLLRDLGGQSVDAGKLAIGTLQTFTDAAKRALPKSATQVNRVE